jgi:hypothetical protein
MKNYEACVTVASVIDNQYIHLAALRTWEAEGQYSITIL